MASSRRDFLITAAALGTSSLGITKAFSSEEQLNSDPYGVLVDTTICIGCRNCEWACKEAHHIEAGSVEEYHNRDIFKQFRRPEPDYFTVVNEFENSKNQVIPINVKYQCMHCNHPACVSACIVGAFTKTKQGAVIWDTDMCIGCRYCMIACPFQVPTFEYEKAFYPKIQKCDFCYPNRTSKGNIPACVENCPVEAILYGKREDVLQVAKTRIKRSPDKYINHIYGEKEVDGTSWLYLSSIDFSSLKLPKLHEKPAPGVSESIQHGIFAYFVPPLALYAWLGGIMWVTKRRNALKEEMKNEEE